MVGKGLGLSIMALGLGLNIWTLVFGPRAYGELLGNWAGEWGKSLGLRVYLVLDFPSLIQNNKNNIKYIYNNSNTNIDTNTKYIQIPILIYIYTNTYTIH